MRYAGDEPTSVGEALAAVQAELGLPPGDALGTLERRWPEVVGADVAAHTHLDAVRDGTLTITVDGSIWATQMRYLEAVVVERAEAFLGPGVVHAVRVRVAGAPRRE